MKHISIHRSVSAEMLDSRNFSQRAALSNQKFGNVAVYLLLRCVLFLFFFMNGPRTTALRLFVQLCPLSSHLIARFTVHIFRSFCATSFNFVLYWVLLLLNFFPISFCSISVFDTGARGGTAS
jgi:hypothetical protein